MGKINLETINVQSFLLQIQRKTKSILQKHTQTPHRRFHRFYKRSIAAFASSALVLPDDHVWLSIVTPVLNSPPRLLEQLVDSFTKQNMAGVELILSDNASTDRKTLAALKRLEATPNVQVISSTVNEGIAVAANAGLAVAQGKWVAFLGHNDLIAPSGLRAIYEALQQNMDCQLLYTDELIVNDKLRITNWFLKPAYDPVLLSGMNYINHFSVFRRERVREIGGLRSEFEGSQYYDLALRYLEGTNDEDVLHLPYPAYWSREKKAHPDTDKTIVNTRKALFQHSQREGWDHVVETALYEKHNRISYTPKEDAWPKVGVVIPNRNKPELIKQILGDLFSNTDYPNLEVFVADNGTTDQETISIYEDYANRFDNFRFEIEPEQFNFARMTNKGLRALDADHYLLLNNDIEVIDADWLKEMASCFAYEKVGIVGTKLLYGNDTIQHAGVIVGLKDLAGHWFYKQPHDLSDPMGRLHVRNSLSCVTGAAMLVSKQCLEEVGMLDETAFAIAYNDVDFCVRAFKAGFRTVWTPFACLYHHESVSRASDADSLSRERFAREKQNLQSRHDTKTINDPAYHPLLSRYDLQADLDLPVRPEGARRWFEH